MKKSIVLTIVIAIISFIVGAVVSFDYTMKTMKVLPENDGVVLIEIYGQEWVYEENPLQ